MAAFTAQRLQTNAAWTARFQFQDAGDISAWSVSGRAQSLKNSTKYVDLDDDNLDLSEGADGVLVLTLSPTETAALGEGTIQFEVMRDAPTPRRPILRFTIKNNLGVAT